MRKKLRNKTSVKHTDEKTERLFICLLSLGVGYGGGAEKMIAMLSRHFSERIDSTFLLYSLNKEKAYNYKGRVIDLKIPLYQRFPIKYFYHILAWWRIFNVFGKERPDTIMVSILFMDIVVLCAYIFSRIIYGIKSTVVVRIANSPEAERKNIFTYMFLRLLYHWVDYFVVVSNELGEKLNKNYSVPESKIRAIYNAVELTCEYCKYNEKEYDFIAVAKLRHQKRLDIFIKAIAEVRKTKPNVKAVILGGGELENYLKQIVEDMNLKDNIEFPGWVNQESVGLYLQKSKIFVLSSDYEGFPNVVVEAMNYGLPIISTDCPTGPKEILNSGEYGILVPVGDHQALGASMLKLLQDDSLMQMYTRLSSQRIQDFNIYQIARQYEDLLSAD